MITTIVVTLGQTGESLISATAKIIGETDRVCFFTVGWDSDLEEARTSLGQLIADIGGEDGVLLLTDMFGGSSTNIALSFHQPNKVEIITGVNLPMIIKASTLPHVVPVHEAATMLKNLGRKSIDIAGEMY